MGVSSLFPSQKLVHALICASLEITNILERPNDEGSLKRGCRVTTSHPGIARVELHTGSKETHRPVHLARAGNMNKR